MRTQFTDSFNFNTVTPAPPVLAAMTAGDDFILGSGAADVLDGLEGDDFIFGLDGADAVRGDVGDLTIDADQPGPVFGNDIVLSGTGEDTVMGDAEDVFVDGTAGDVDVVTGNDLIVDNYGWNEVYGDADDLDIDIAGSDAAVRVTTGNDVISGSGWLFGDVGSVAIQNPDAGSVEVQFGNDVIIGGTEVYGDAFFADVKADGDASVLLAAGNDIINTGSGDDYVFGDFGWLNVDWEDDAWIASVIGGNDIIEAGEGNDLIYGDFEQFNDYYFAEAPDGVDYTPGADIFVFKFGYPTHFGHDTIVDFNVGIDKLYFEGFEGIDILNSDWVDIEFQDYSNSLYIDMTAVGGGTINLYGVEALSAEDVIVG